MKEKNNINGLCSIEDICTDKSKNFTKQFVEKLNNNEFIKDTCTQVGEEFMPTDDVVEEEQGKAY